MNKQEMIYQLKMIIQNKLETQISGQLKESDRLYEDLSIDSIKLLQLVVYLEEQFDVTVPEVDLDPGAFITVGSLLTFIEALQGNRVG